MLEKKRRGGEVGEDKEEEVEGKEREGEGGVRTKRRGGDVQFAQLLSVTEVGKMESRDPPE